MMNNCKVNNRAHVEGHLNIDSTILWNILPYIYYNA
jgi:hypothetical protein